MIYFDGYFSIKTAIDINQQILQSTNFVHVANYDWITQKFQIIFRHGNVHHLNGKTNLLTKFPNN